MAFEANPTLYEGMRGNPDLNEHQITVYNLAITNKAGSASFSIFHEERGTGSLLSFIDQEEIQQFTVETRRLDQLPECTRAGTIALWVDVEGCSFEVLEGAAGIMDAVVMVQAEVELQQLWKDQKLEQEFRSLMAEHDFVPVARGVYTLHGDMLFLKRDLATQFRIFRKITGFKAYHKAYHTAAQWGSAFQIKSHFPRFFAFMKNRLGKWLP